MIRRLLSYLAVPVVWSPTSDVVTDPLLDRVLPPEQCWHHPDSGRRLDAPWPEWSAP